MQARETVRSEAVEAHVTFLCDDALEGRNNDTPGYEIAARYVRSQFSAMRLLPGNNGDWFQTIPLVIPGSEDDDPAILSINGVAQSYSDASIYVRQEGTLSWSGGTVFAGRFVGDREAELMRLSGLDVRGKLVAVFPEPVNGLSREGRAQVSEFAAKREALLFRNGAAGLIMLPPLETSDAVVAARQPVEPVWLMTDEEVRAPSRYPILGELSHSSATLLFSGSARAFDDVFGEALRGTADSIDLKARLTLAGGRKWQRSNSTNILGLIPGSDPNLRDETVVVTAHLDHIGHDGDADGGDDIRNGALDNAVGVALLLEIARELKQGPGPRRSVLFAAVACEEDGLIGSRFLAGNLPVGVGQPVAVLNIDMPILTYPFSDIVAFGGQESTLGEVVKQAATRRGLAVSDTPDDMLGFFRSSDQFSFVEKGVPALFLQPGPAGQGREAISRFMHSVYHSPHDDIRQSIDWAAGSRFGDLNLAILTEIANARRAPQWYVDSPYGNAYAPNAEKRPRSASLSPSHR